MSCTGILMHEIGHLTVLMSQNEELEAGWIRPALDNDEETELLCSKATPGGLEDTVFACAFAFCEVNTALACKLLPQSSETVAAMFEMIVSANEPQLWAATLHASDSDIAKLRASDIPAGLWHHALAQGVMLVKSRGHQKRMKALLAEYKSKGVLTLTRSDVEGMFDG